MSPAGILALVAVAASPNAMEPPPFSGAALFVENDAFNLVRPTDQNYTGGGALQVSGLGVKWAAAPLELIDRITGLENRLVELDKEDGRTFRGYSLSFGITGFTPKDLTIDEPIHDDRPYGSLDFLMVSRASAFERLGVAISTELTVGVLGFDQAHQVQSFVHRVIRGVRGCQDADPDCHPHDPKGWPHQVSAGGEPTLRYGLAAEKLLVDARASDWARFDLKGLGRLDLGYYTGAAAGFAFRAGRVSSPFWSYNTAPVNGQNQMVPALAASPEQATRARSLELYLVGGLRGRVVGYNALLQGQFRPSAVQLSDTQVYRLLYEFELGLTASWQGAGLTWMAFAGRSPELNAGGGIRHQVWSSFYLWYRYW